MGNRQWRVGRVAIPGLRASSGPEMSRSPAKKRLEWSEIGVLAMLGGLLVFGFAANGLSLLQSAVSLGFGAGVLVIAWLWRLTLRRAETAPPPTWRQTAWDAGMFVAWLAVMGALHGGGTRRTVLIAHGRKARRPQSSRACRKTRPRTTPRPNRRRTPRAMSRTAPHSATRLYHGRRSAGRSADLDATQKRLRRGSPPVDGACLPRASRRVCRLRSRRELGCL